MSPCVTGWLGSSYCVTRATSGDAETDKTIVFLLLAVLVLLGVLLAARSFVRAFLEWRAGPEEPFVDDGIEGDARLFDGVVQRYIGSYVNGDGQEVSRYDYAEGDGDESTDEQRRYDNL